MAYEPINNKPFRSYEQWLLLILPLIGIAFFAALRLFQQRAAWQQLAGMLACVGLAFAVWYGCRFFYLRLRRVQKHRLRYRHFLILYFCTALSYSGVLAAAFFTLLQQYTPVPYPVLPLALTVAFLAAFISVVYESIMLHEQLEQHRQKNGRLRKANTLTELNSWKTRIDPHFLFNSLNTLQNLIIEDRATANNFNRSLSEMFAQVLHFSKKNLVSVAEELDVMYQYHYLISIRFPDAVQLTVSFQEFDLRRLQLPPLSLQLLFENAVKHNRFSSRQPLQINIDITHTEIIFSNRIHTRDLTVRSSKTGLQILSERCRILMNREITIHKTSELFLVHLPIKKQRYESVDH